MPCFWESTKPFCGFSERQLCERDRRMPVFPAHFMKIRKWGEHMNRKVKENYGRLAQAAGLSMDMENGALYGVFAGYEILVAAANGSYPYTLSILAGVNRPAPPLTQEECKAFCKSVPGAVTLTQNGNLVTLALKNTANQNKLRDTLVGALQAFTNFLRGNGFRNCCQACGRQELPVSPYYLGGAYAELCPDCFTAIQQRQTAAQSESKQKKENVVSGTVGALLGSLLGVVCIIILSQLGYVAAISGVIMAVCTLKGYELLGGKLSNKGIAIACVLMLVMTFVGDRLDWAIVVSRSLGTDFFTSFRAISYLMAEGAIDSGSYVGNLVLLYLFVLLGAVPTVIGTLRSRKQSAKIYRLGSHL